MAGTADWRLHRDAALVALERERRPSNRTQAANALLELAAVHDERWPELIPSVPRLLSDAQPDVRRVGLALAALTLPPEEAEPLLATRLKDASAEVRMEAAGQLADLHRPSTRGALAVALTDGALTVRFEAARGMAALQHSAGLEVLIEGLGQDPLRFRALGALAQLGDARALPEVRTVYRRWLLPPFERTQAAGALAKLGDAEGAEYLMARTFRRFWSPDRPLALELLGEVKAAGAFERLSAVLADRKDPGRGAAARGLGRLGDPRALPALGAALDEPGAPEDLRLDVAEGLCRLRLPEARARVQGALASFPTRDARLEVEGMLEETAP